MKMKKQYETPDAKKVEFSYEENVKASGTYWNFDPPKNKCIPQCKEIPAGCSFVSDKK